MGVRDTITFYFRKVYNTSPRQLLLWNNVLLTICSTALTAFALYMCVLFYESFTEENSTESTGSDWIQWLGLVIVGFSLTSTCIVGIRGAYLVSLEMLLMYFWGVAVFLAPLLLGTVTCFDFYSYINVYFRHHWEEDEFLGLRKIFCKSGTASNKCKCPILGGPFYDNETSWCMGVYNATDCEEIRTDAENKGLEWGKLLTLVEASVGILNVAEIFFSLYLCFKILTAPVIEKSMLEMINYLLILPVAGCCGLSNYLWWMREHDLEYSWLTDFFIALAAAQVGLIPMGVLAGRLKHSTLLISYIVSLSIVILALGSAGTACMLFSVVLPEEFVPTTSEAADIACSRDLPGCCCCYNDDVSADNYCPEWTKEEIIQLSVLDLKMAGIVSFLCITYLLGALVVAGRFSNKLVNYKTEYV
jgi:hypothetical protein